MTKQPNAGGRSVLLVMSDLHVGSMFAVRPLEWETREGDVRIASPSQRVLHDYWLHCWDSAKKLAGRDPLYVLLNGDLIEGNKKPFRGELWTGRLLDQQEAAVVLLSEQMGRVKQAVVVQGTPFHVEESGTVEDKIAQEIGAYGLRAWSRPVFSVGGVTFEAVHKGPKFGGRDWTFTNPMRYHVQSIMSARLKAHMACPDVFFYSHYHRLTDTGPIIEDTLDGEHHVTRGFITPSFKLIDEWTNHTPTPYADIGMLAFECERGEYEVHKWVKRINPTQEITLT